jgi:nitric oxide reductase NorD protein
MEEHVGQLWHRLITRTAATHHPQAAVTLSEVARSVGILFRALGGEGGLRVESAAAVAHGARRTWLQRIAGSHRKATLAWRDGETLRLPESIALFPDANLNRELYLWLAALATTPITETDWFTANQQRTLDVLNRFPGIISRYQRLVAAHLRLRPEPTSLPALEAVAEGAIRAALETPGSVAKLPAAPRPPQPVYLWLYPLPPTAQNAAAPEREESEPTPAADSQAGSSQRRRAERVDDPDGKSGLLAFRLESLFSWCEYLKIDRTTDDSRDPRAKQAADDLDVISISRGTPPASRLRFDLDLPAAENDDRPLGAGIKLPEWDYRKQTLRADHCRLQPLIADTAPPCELPANLVRMARQLRRQFQSLLPLATWRRGEPDGCEIDLDAWLQHTIDRQRGHVVGSSNLYRDFRKNNRSLACLLLADLSLSTDAWIADSGKVIDVIRDSLFLFSEALSATGDDFALYGFSSRRRDPIRFHTLKTFSEPYTATVRGRIQAIRPGYYTRMGAAIRYASRLLSQQNATQRLMILLSDGKPNDMDQYEGRYGIEDTRMAIIEARRLGLETFCVTIDEQASDYMPYLFGSGAYGVIRRPADLPRRLPLLYARLTR